MKSLKNGWRLIIYGLVDPNTEQVRYIGKSSSYLRRPKDHFRPSVIREGTFPVNRWCQKLVRNGQKPAICILEDFGTCFDKDEANEILNEGEIRWIAFGRSEGWPLLNLTDGGDGLLGHPGGMLGKHHSDEVKARISEQLRGRKRPPEVVEKIRKSALGRQVSEDTRAKMSVSAKGHQRWVGKRHSEQSKQKMRTSHLGRKMDAETKEKIRQSVLARFRMKKQTAPSL